MRTFNELSRVYQELRNTHGMNLKNLSETTGISYQHLSRQLSGSSKFTNATYDKIMEVAAAKGIIQVVAEHMPDYNSNISIEGGTFDILLRVKMRNNEISGVMWDKIKAT